MQVTIRLLKRQDIDLIAMKKAGVPLSRIFVDALYAFARGEKYQVTIPAVKNIEIESACKKAVEHRRNGRDVEVDVPVRLDSSVSDPLSIKVLSALRPVYGNSFAKQLIRNSISNSTLLPFFMTAKDAERKAEKELSKGKITKENAAEMIETARSVTLDIEAHDEAAASGGQTVISDVVKVKASDEQKKNEDSTGKCEPAKTEPQKEKPKPPSEPRKEPVREPAITAHADADASVIDETSEDEALSQFMGLVAIK